MYTNYNMRNNPNYMYNKNYYPNDYSNNGDRFGLLGPLLLGGIAGYALGSPGFGFGRPCCPPPFYPPVYPVPYPQPVPYAQPVPYSGQQAYQSYNFYYK